MSDSLPENSRTETGFKAGEPPLPVPTTEQPLAYKPISGWAIAGCIAGGLFALLVAVSTVVALTQGAPLFFPTWIVVLAALGVVLSLIGQRHVQNSDGTRAGGKLAATGLWLSLISGLSYFSYYYVTGLALENQANAFLMEKTDQDSGFFPRLREGADDPAQLNAAFLLTRPATDRGRARPDNEKEMRLAYDVGQKDMPGDLTQFREHPFVRLLFKESAKDAEITPLAVQEWEYKQRMYKIVRNYRIKTREVQADFRIAVFSTEADGAGQGRKWFLNMRETHMVTRNLTPFGAGLSHLRALAKVRLNEWSIKPEVGALKEIAAKDQSRWEELVPDAAQRAERRALIYQLCTGAKPLPGFQVLGRDDEVGRWEMVNGKPQLSYTFRLVLPREPNGPAAYTVDGRAVLESTTAIDPSQFGEGSPMPQWTLVRVVFTSVAAVAERKAKGGPG